MKHASMPVEPPQEVVIFGATSELAQCVLRLHAEHSDSVRLIARNDEKLALVAQDASVRGAKVSETFVADLSNIDQAGDIAERLCQQLQGNVLWYFFQGQLPDQQDAQTDWNTTQLSFDTNFGGIAKSLHYIAQHIEQHRAGTVVVITSVAGLRGRQSNYVYGTGKGALNIYLQGLRNRLQPYDGKVVTIMPGFIKTAMTAGMKRSGILWATPERVAKDVYKSAIKGREVCFTPWFWRYIMLIIQHIPEKLFKRLKL